MGNFKPTAHPLIPVPTVKAAKLMGEREWIKTLRWREEIIEREQHDPLQYGWEPKIWQLWDAIIEWPWLDKEWCARIRAALGFDRAVTILVILGGNRAGKTEYAAKRMSQFMHWKAGAVIWPFHQSAPMSIETHHKLMWKFLPPELRRFVRGTVGYISYKQKTGFSDKKYVLPNSSECRFKNYTMEKDDALQGPEIDGFWGDELIPPDWIEDLLIRLATREGKGIVTFTPVQGYTATVKMVQDGATVVLDEPAFLAPRDEGEQDEARALGFESEQAAKTAKERGVLCVPPEWEFVEEKGGAKDSAPIRVRAPGVPEGRRFERMPRVMRCVDPNYGLVFFHGRDNPFGNPYSVLEKVRGKDAGYVKERWYGWANRTVSALFTKFEPKVHVVKAEDIPQKGTNYMLIDPAKKRNFVMKWYRVTQGAVYLYREWPSYYEVPSLGVPGAWALPDGKKLDGRPGPAQRSFGWGLLRYKQEIARLEGWDDALQGVSRRAREEDEERRRRGERVRRRGPTIAERDVRNWNPDGGAKEKVFERYMDSRAASEPKVENDRPRTLQTDFADMGLDFMLTPGDDISVGVALITDALDYDPDLPLDYFNRPDFYVCEECRNSIFALQTWTGEDGNKGACKDLIDLDRYLFLTDPQYVDEEEFYEAAGGGYY